MPVNMTHTVNGVESSLVTKCLDFCQALSRQGKAFNFNLNVGSSFTFSLDTRVKSIPPEMVRKKLSPSSIRGDARRREKKRSTQQRYKAVQFDQFDYTANL